MTREQLLEKSLESLREIAKAQGVKSITKYRKAELVEIIMNGGIVARNQPIFGAYSQLSQMPDPIAAAKAKQLAKAAFGWMGTARHLVGPSLCGNVSPAQVVFAHPPHRCSISGSSA